jgi:hypothetical protein
MPKQSNQYRVAFAAAALVAAAPAHAVVPVLNALGQSGGLLIPYGFVLPQGDAEMLYGNYLDPRYGHVANAAHTYTAGVGILPYVEVSGGLLDYPGNVPPQLPGGDRFVFRHLMANLKVQVPQFVSWQPQIAFGVSDVGGQTHFMRSTYGVVTEALGPASFTLGYGHGDRLDGLFGGLALDLAGTGLSALLEDDARTPYAGLRYVSPSVHWLGDASVVATVARALKSTDGASARTSFSIGVRIPLGHRFADTVQAQPRIDQGAIPAASLPDATGVEAVAAPRVRSEPAALPVARTQPVLASPLAAAAPDPTRQRAAVDRTQAVGAVDPGTVSTRTLAALDAIFARLRAAGLERVRVGLLGHVLVVEYENHRFGQNEADALGVVLGAAVEGAPENIEFVRAVIMKAGAPVGELTVPRQAYLHFLADGDSSAVRAALSMRGTRSEDEQRVVWYGNGHSHTAVRVRVSPALNYVYGTEYGVFDISAGANVEAFVPLWRGAELYANAIAPLANTRNMDRGQVFDADRLRGGLANVALAQAFHIGPHVLDVVAAGRLNFHYLGVENETIAFIPGRDDMVRLRLAYLHREPGQQAIGDLKTADLTYRFAAPQWKLWVEAGVARYEAGDRGPHLTITRWFDDVAVSVAGAHSGRGSFVGASVSVPLTPRAGMHPGFVTLAGTPNFSPTFRTQVGATNYLANDGVRQLTFAYDASREVLNEGRFGAQYFASALPRMRDAYERYVDHPSRALPASPRQREPLGNIDERDAEAAP